MILARKRCSIIFPLPCPELVIWSTLSIVKGLSCPLVQTNCLCEKLVLLFLWKLSEDSSNFHVVEIEKPLILLISAACSAGIYTYIHIHICWYICITILF